jgi:hypothetical protein
VVLLSWCQPVRRHSTPDFGISHFRKYWLFFRNNDFGLDVSGGSVSGCRRRVELPLASLKEQACGYIKEYFLNKIKTLNYP